MSFGYSYTSDVKIRLYLFCTTYDQSNKLFWLDHRTAQELKASGSSPALGKRTVVLGASSSHLGQIGHVYGKFSESLGMAVSVTELLRGFREIFGVTILNRPAVHLTPLVTELIAQLGCLHLFSLLLVVNFSPFRYLVVLVSLSILHYNM